MMFVEYLQKRCCIEEVEGVPFSKVIVGNLTTVEGATSIFENSRRARLSTEASSVGVLALVRKHEAVY